MRTTTRPSTAHCTLPMYIGFILSEPNFGSCCRLSEIMSISHDSVNRFLNRESFTLKDLFDEAKNDLNLEGGILSVDDTVLDKPYASTMDLVGWFWSGKHKKTVLGINLITLYYIDIQGKHAPINYRIYDKNEGKTKNDYFREMLVEVLSWGVKPNLVTKDSWYSSVENLNFVKKYKLGFLAALESNRMISIEKGTWIQVSSLDIPKEGIAVHLRNVGYVKVFKSWFKNQPRYYAVHLPDIKQLNELKVEDFRHLHDQHWLIEQYHRTLKQVCNVDKFQVRKGVAIRNHIFSAICGYVYLRKLCITDFISNCYRLQRDLFNDVIAAFIETFSVDKAHLLPQIQSSVNA